MTVARLMAEQIYQELTKLDWQRTRAPPAGGKQPAPVPGLPPLDLNRRYSVKETCRYLSVSHAMVYQRIREGELKPLKDGKRTFIHGSEIARYGASRL